MSRGEEENPAHAVLLQIVQGGAAACGIKAGFDLGLYEVLQAGPATSAELAKKIEAHEPSLRRLMRGLAAIGVVAEPEPGRYELGELGVPLAPGTSTAPASSIEPILRYDLGELMVSSWTRLAKSVRTGQPVCGPETPEDIGIHDRALAAYSTQGLAPLLKAYDFSRFKTVVDVGGGMGQVLAGILDAHPGVRGVLFDQATTAAAASDFLKEAKVFDRCRVVAGDMYESVPAGGDLYVVSKVFNDLGDEAVERVLQNIRTAMAPEGRLAVIEMLGSTAPSLEEIFRDLTFLVKTNGGRVRTQEDFQELFGRAGLAVERVVPTEGEYSVVEGRVAQP